MVDDRAGVVAVDGAAGFLCDVISIDSRLTRVPPGKRSVFFLSPPFAAHRFLDGGSGAVLRVRSSRLLGRGRWLLPATTTTRKQSKAIPGSTRPTTVPSYN